MNRYRFPIAILILTVLTFGLLITANPTNTTQAAPRTVPWDCSDWQATPAVADAADARVSLILESLAANRGKAIYCAIDQSDTWTKTETWLAGRDRNERDDTVYFGQQGNFRGFLAAQEGYLTDGESGVTGVSRELIFEFPEEPRRGKKTVIKRRDFPVDDRFCNPYGGADGETYQNQPAYDPTCRRALSPFGSNVGYNAPVSNPDPSSGWPNSARNGFRGSIINNPNNYDWGPATQAAATAYCQSRGYQRAINVVATDPSISGLARWVYRRGIENPAQPGQGTYAYHAALINSWSATCEKKVRVRRR